MWMCQCVIIYFQHEYTGESACVCLRICFQHKCTCGCVVDIYMYVLNTIFCQLSVSMHATYADLPNSESKLLEKINYIKDT